MSMILGALLVVVGVLASAVADRIRGLRVEKRTESRASATLVPRKQPRSEQSEVPEPRGERRLLGDQVVEALVTAGWKKPVAREATWQVALAERASLEAWTRAALKSMGGLS
jgi:Holliday junction resolvasome RuvABC DNA-binding subunit